MKRRNFFGAVLGTIGSLPFVKAETVQSLFGALDSLTYVTYPPTDLGDTSLLLDKPRTAIEFLRITGVDCLSGERVEFSTMKDIYLDIRDRVLVYGSPQRVVTITGIETRAEPCRKPNQS